MIEDGRIGRQSGDRKLVYVTAKPARSQQVPRDVVEPETLAEIVQCSRGFHSVTLAAAEGTRSGRMGACGCSARIGSHARPSRASSRSAAAGPVLPAA